MRKWRYAEGGIAVGRWYLHDGGGALRGGEWMEGGLRETKEGRGEVIGREAFVLCVETDSIKEIEGYASYGLVVEVSWDDATSFCTQYQQRKNLLRVTTTKYKSD